MAEDKIKVCWITGSYNHSREIIDKIKRSLGNDVCVECYGEDLSAEYIEMQILGSGLFSSNRLVILKDLPQYSGSKSNPRWKNLLSNIPDDCVVIIDRVLASSRRVLYKYVQEIGKIFDLPLYIKKSDAFSYVETEFNKCGKSINQDAVSLFLQRMGEQSSDGISVDTMYMSIRQICFYLGKRKKSISVEEISVAQSINYSNIIWDIFTALDNRDYFECQKLFYHICKSSSIPEAIEQICNMMLWRYRLLLLIKEQKSNNIPDNKIIQEILKLHKLSKEGTASQAIFALDSTTAYGENVINNTVKGFYSKSSPVEFYSRTEIFKIVGVIHECNLKLRDVDSDIESIIIVDNIFMFICGIIDGDILARMRRLKNE